ncbi:hypothetical protein, partial [Parasedimentitalea maritima]|uniref:hypothetical protein n=1 Tax=Parasedimentitalea maritima TaxID=2578117 RepID=UPI001ADCED98
WTATAVRVPGSGSLPGFWTRRCRPAASGKAGLVLHQSLAVLRKGAALAGGVGRAAKARYRQVASALKR